jgi:putative endonuclease
LFHLGGPHLAGHDSLGENASPVFRAITVWQQKTYYVYILASKRNGTLYIGVTHDLAFRVWQHKNGSLPGFTKTHDVKMLVYFEMFGDIHDAIHRETRLKKYKREWKLNLIQKDNLEWRDLAEDWYG